VTKLYEQWWERKLGGIYTDISGNKHDAPAEDGFVNWMEDPCYDNVYDKLEIDEFLSSNSKVVHHEWEFGRFGHSCAILQIEVDSEK